MKGEILPNDEIPNQVDYVAPSTMRLELKNAESELVVLKHELKEAREEVKLLRIIQRNTNPSIIPDWKSVFDEASGQKHDIAFEYKTMTVKKKTKRGKLIP